jgi:hypothetical protein
LPYALLKDKIMTDSLKNILLIGITSLFLPLLMDWWWYVPVCFTGAFLWPVTGIKNFAIAFLMIFMIWTGWAWYKDTDAHISVASTMANILGDLPPAIMYPVSGVIGGLTGGLAALTGYLFSKSRKN